MKLSLIILLLCPCVFSFTFLQVPDKNAIDAKKSFDTISEKFLLPQDFDLAESTPVRQPSTNEMVAMENKDLFEGDILGVPIDEDPTKYIQRDLPIDSADKYDYIFKQKYYSSLNLATYPDKLWSDGRVPYMLEEGMTTTQRAAIAQAFEEYKKKTCIRFEPRNEDDADYIYIKRNRGFGCSSYVGRAGGNQTVSLEIGKCFSKGIIAHELMHSIGFFHEHSRTDRDEFVTINEDNIRPGMMRNFEKYPRKIIDPLGMPYDYESVMHYHKLAFSKNGKPTLVPKDDNVEIGQRYKLSDVDAKKINKLYKCMEFAVTKPGVEPTDLEEIDSEEDLDYTTTKTIKTTQKPKITERYTRWPIKKTTSTTTESPDSSITTKTTTFVETTTTTNAPHTTHVKTMKQSSTTTSKPTTKSDKNSGKKEKCENLNAHCEMWEQLGHCQHSIKYMKHYCRKACNFCDIDEVPATTTSKPPILEKTREKSKEVITKTLPPKTIKPSLTKNKENGSKTSCVDKNLFCGYWAKIGECKSESKFMKIFCKRACNLCGDQVDKMYAPNPRK
uniref:Metalloendopeptidase n=1 Tax=Rhabditophanes sp. KR3021 TaxID=114890 RepID=A0AC35TKW6_9BILA